MRDIKFRGIPKKVNYYEIINGEKQKPFIYGGYYCDYKYGGCPEGEDNIIHFNSFGIGFNDFTIVEKETVGQYTGIKDKNGVEIYEGDIIKNKIHDASTVYFEDGSYKVKIKNNENRSTIYNLGHLLDKWKFKVIGNIHQNKELLND